MSTDCSGSKDELIAAGWLPPDEAERLKAATKQAINDLTTDWFNLVEDLKAERAAVQPVIDAARKWVAFAMSDKPNREMLAVEMTLFYAVQALDADSPPEGPTQ